MAYAQTAAHGQQVEFDPVSRVAGALALHATIDAGGRVSDATAMAGTFRGYELLLQRSRRARRDLHLQPRLRRLRRRARDLLGARAGDDRSASARRSTGSRSATCSRRSRTSIDHPAHLFLRAGPDYSEPVVRDTNPELWTRAQTTPAAGVDDPRLQARSRTS